jgi:hypothetical protein
MFHRSSLSCACPVLFFMRTITLLITFSGCNTPAELEQKPKPFAHAEPKISSPASPMSIEPNPIRLGTLAPGEIGRFSVILRNPGRDLATVERVESSCPCVRLMPIPVQVEPDGSTSVVAEFDPVHEPDFRGSLAVHLEGYDEANVLQFRTTVELTVSSPKSAGTGPKLDGP